MKILSDQSISKYFIHLYTATVIYGSLKFDKAGTVNLGSFFSVTMLYQLVFFKMRELQG